MDNVNLFFLIHNLNHKSFILDDLMLFGAIYLIYIAILLMFVLAFKDRAKERKALILAILSILATLILIEIIHLFVYEPRPFVAFNFIPLAAVLAKHCLVFCCVTADQNRFRATETTYIERRLYCAREAQGVLP